MATRKPSKKKPEQKPFDEFGFRRSGAQLATPVSAPALPGPSPLPAAIQQMATGLPSASPMPAAPSPAMLPPPAQLAMANLPQPMPAMPFPQGPSFQNAGLQPADGMTVPPIPNSELLAMLRASGAGVPQNSLAAAEYGGLGGPLNGVVGTGGNVPGQVAPPYSQGVPAAIDPAVIDRMLKTKALLSDIAAIQQGGLPNYAGTASQDRLAQGYAPGPYQFNMPNPNAPLADPEAAARDRVGRQGRRASRTGQFEQRLLNAGMPQTPPEMQRQTRPTLTPQQFLAEQAARQQEADQAVAKASQAMQEGGANQAAFDNLVAAQKKAKGVNPTRAQAQTYETVADKRGMLPGMNGNPTVAENLANRQEVLANRKKAVVARGETRGKAKELGISRAQAAALNGTLSKNGNNLTSFGDIFNHYLGMTGNPQMAAMLADAHHKAQSTDPREQALLAAITQAQNPEATKYLTDLHKKVFGGAQSQPEFPGADPAKTEAVAKEARDKFPSNPRKMSDYLISNAGLSREEADALTKKMHPEGKRFDRAAAEAAKRKMDIETSRALFDPNQFGQANMIPGFRPAASNFAEWMAPFVGAMGNITGNTDRANELNAGIH